MNFKNPFMITVYKIIATVFIIIILTAIKVNNNDKLPAIFLVLAVIGIPAIWKYQPIKTVAQPYRPKNNLTNTNIVATNDLLVSEVKTDLNELNIATSSTNVSETKENKAPIDNKYYLKNRIKNSLEYMKSNLRLTQQIIFAIITRCLAILFILPLVVFCLVFLNKFLGYYLREKHITLDFFYQNNLLDDSDYKFLTMPMVVFLLGGAYLGYLFLVIKTNKTTK